MTEGRVVYAHGTPALPRIVSSLDKAKALALADAVRTGEPAPVLAVDLQHPEVSVTVLGYVHPDGSYNIHQP